MKHPPITSEDVRKCREETGAGVHEAKLMLNRDRMNRILNDRFWFLHLREILRYLVNRS